MDKIHTVRYIPRIHTQGSRFAVFYYVLVMVEFNHIRALFQYPIRRLIARSREVSKPLDLYLELYDRSDIWQAHWQHCCRCACQISKRCNDWNYQSRGFETSLDLMIGRIIGYWRIQVASLPLSKSCDCPNASDGVLTISFKVSALVLWQPCDAEGNNTIFQNQRSNSEICKWILCIHKVSHRDSAK